ncbi:MAG: PCP reductase family protein, partial [Rhodothermales bacterium]|nr:PCP reductase family protein [Rhodothermales bacterium]
VSGTAAGEACARAAEKTNDPTQQSNEAHDEGSSGRCPFTAMVNEAFDQAAPSDADLVWTAEALERLERIPSYVRPMVEKGIVEYAREKGLAEIDGEVMSAARGRFGM